MNRSGVELIHRTSASHANVAGDVHGGWILKWLDDAAVVAATRHCRTRVVTVGLNGVLFGQPVRVGELLSFRAMVNAVWRTSMEVGVRVEAEDTIEDRNTHVLTAYATMVSLDVRGQPSVVAQRDIDGPDADRRHRDAQARRGTRLEGQARDARQ